MASITSALPRVVVRASSAGRTRVQQQRTGGPVRSGAAAKNVKSSTFLGTTSSSSARSVRCNLSFDEGDDTTDKTLNSLDAILQGSTDEPEYDGPDTENEQANKDGLRKPGEISPEMRKKLLGESVGLGGLPEKPNEPECES